MNVIIIGAGGHSKIVIDILEENNEFNILGLLDDNKDIHGELVLGKKILGNIESIKDYDPAELKLTVKVLLKFI